MVCFFCNDRFHLSQNCNIYASDDDRKKLIYSKEYCLDCLKPFKNCCCFSSNKKFIKPKCYSCFSYGHNDIFCSERFKTPTFFHPKIDNDLVVRFYQMLSLIDQYYIAFSSPTAFNLVNPKMFKVVNAPEIDFDNLKEYKDRIVSGTHTINLYAFNIYPVKFDLKILKNFILKPKIVSLSSLTISKSDLFRFLSDSIESFECTYLTISPSVSLVDILKRIPNIKRLLLNKTRIEIPPTWPEDMLQYLGDKKLSHLSLMIKNIDFNVDMLVKLINEKLQRDAKIHLTLDIPSKQEETRQIIAEKLSTYFFPPNNFLLRNHEISPELSFDFFLTPFEYRDSQSKDRVISFKLISKNFMT